MEKENQRKSIDTFFRNEYRKLVNYAGRRIDERFGGSSPEDIVQEVMLSLLERLNPDVQIGNLAAYAWRSLRYRVIDYQRKKQNTIPLSQAGNASGQEALLAAPVTATVPEPPAWAAITPEQLQDAIAKLNPGEQALVTATVYGNQTFEELSRDWNVPVGTLLSRKHRLLAKMQRTLSGQ